jgi:SAM-dependent methyltransferase
MSKMSSTAPAITIRGVAALAGLSQSVRERLGRVASLGRAVDGTVLALEGRPSRTTCILLEAEVAADRGIAQRSRTSWTRGTTLGLWRGRSHAPASFSVVKPGLVLFVPKIEVVRMGLEERFVEHSPRVSANDFVARRTLPNDLVIVNQIVGRRRFARALDIGAGGGTFSLILRSFVDRVVLVEPDPVMLNLARARLAAEGGRRWFDLRMAGAEQLPFRASSVDLVASRLAAHHVPSLDRFVGEARRVLRTGGSLLVSDIIARSNAAIATLDGLERTVDPTHQSARSLDVWRDTVACHGFAIDRVYLTRRKVLVADKPHGTERVAAVNRALAKLSSAERKLVGTFGEGSDAPGWTDTRMVLHAVVRKGRRAA